MGDSKYPPSMIEALAAACREFPLREKIVIVPTFQAGRQVGEALTRAAGGWVNLRFVTPYALAGEIAAEALDAAGSTSIAATHALDRLRAVVESLWAEGRLPYFRGTAGPSGSDSSQQGFGPPADLDAGPSRGLVRAIHKAVQSMRLDGLSSTDLRPGLFDVEEKGKDLRLILERYEGLLDGARELDPPALYDFARRARAGRPPRNDATPLYFRYADTRYFRRIDDFLRDLAGDGNLIELSRSGVRGLDRPRRYPPLPSADAPPTPADPVRFDVERLPWLFAPDEAPALRALDGPADPDVLAASRILCGTIASEAAAPGDGRPPTLGIFRAVGASNECREIVRRVLASGTPLDHVEVIVPPGSGSAARFHLLSLRTGLPMTFAGGLPLELTRPGRALLEFLDWIEHDFPEANLRRMLEAGDVELSAGGASDVPAGSRAARLLRSAGIGWGRQRYAERLANAAADRARDIEALRHPRKDSPEDERDDGGDVEARLAALERDVREYRGLIRAVSSLLDLVPAADGRGRWSSRDLRRAARTFVERHSAAPTEVDRAARDRILAGLDPGDETDIPGESAVTPARAIARLRTDLGELAAGESPPRPGALHVADFGSGGFSGRPVSFVCGLDEAAFPGAVFQDPILLDRDKSHLSESLPMSGDLLRERLYDMAAMLANLGHGERRPESPEGGGRAGSSGARPHRVVFSYSCYDVSDERPSSASSLVLQVFRLMTANPRASYSDLEKALAGPAVPTPAPQSSGPVGGFVPDAEAKALDDLDWWLRRIDPDGRPRRAGRALREAFPSLERGLSALARRDSPELTEYDGCVRIDRKLHQPAGNADLYVSPSRLEQLADCPYGYLLRNLLRIRPPDDIEFDPTAWLDPRERGSLVHGILSDFMTDATKDGRRMDPRRDRARLLETAERAMARTKVEIPPPSDVVFDRQRADILDTCEIFLRMESRRPKDVRPVLFEEPFKDLVVSVKGHGPLRISGVIDRVDRVGPGRYRVIDYKTGGPRKYEAAERFGLGTVLQYALYALAAEKILADRGEPGEVVESGYAFPTRRGDGAEVMIGFDRQGLSEVLGVLMDLVDGGLFFAGRDAHCDWCDYQPACGSGAPARTKDKVPNGKDAEDDAVGDKAKLAARLMGLMKRFK